jgi:hypothetical protein
MRRSSFHNASFDISFINAELGRLNRPQIPRARIRLANPMTGGQLALDNQGFASSVSGSYFNIRVSR